MHWKIKAAIQGVVALLPSELSYAAYYRIQRRFGALRDSTPTEHIKAGIRTWQLITQTGRDPVNKVFFEVGTGRIPTVPIAFWLMGAKRTLTIDINPYLKDELVEDTVQFIAEHEQHVVELFGDLLLPARLDALTTLFRSGRGTLDRVLDLCGIDYVVPCDAANTGLPDRSIDFHTSYTVLEHIPPDVVVAILEEGNRIVHEDGLFVHMVDYSDHFSHSYDAINRLNFLKYSDAMWSVYAGNRYMYTNRLRHDDMLALYSKAGHEVLATYPYGDERTRKLIAAGKLPLSRRFKDKDPAILAIPACWIVSRTIEGGEPVGH